MPDAGPFSNENVSYCKAYHLHFPGEYDQVLAAMRRAGFADPGAFVYWAVLQRTAEVMQERVEVI